jgi:hypothetical protein
MRKGAGESTLVWASVRECPLSDGVAGPFSRRLLSYIPSDACAGARTQLRSVRPVVFGSGRWFFATGGLAEPLRLENPTTIVPGDRVTHLVYEVCTG